MHPTFVSEPPSPDRQETETRGRAKANRRGAPQRGEAAIFLGADGRLCHADDHARAGA